jgi:hypothetical protein
VPRIEAIAGQDRKVHVLKNNSYQRTAIVNAQDMLRLLGQCVREPHRIQRARDQPLATKSVTWLEKRAATRAWRGVYRARAGPCALD